MHKTIEMARNPSSLSPDQAEELNSALQYVGLNNVSPAVRQRYASEVSKIWTEESSKAKPNLTKAVK
ncbi:MAG: hypothetical protein NT033_06470 [Candidatus Omnitrophica bacterium]|nr:hypothetical protein [Candidatus Omnitrophota bacterium]